MSTEQTELNPNWAPPPPTTSSSTKLELGLGIGCAVVLFLCCGGFLAVSFYATSWVSKGVSTDPGTVNNVAAQIAEIDGPDDFEPVSSSDLRVPMADAAMMRAAIFRDWECDSTLVLATGAAFNSEDPQHIQANLRKSLGQQAGSQESLQQTQVTEHILTIRDKPCKFLFITGLSQESKAKRIQVMGAFPAKEGQAVLFIEADAKEYPKADLLKILESIE